MFTSRAQARIQMKQAAGPNLGNFGQRTERHWNKTPKPHPTQERPSGCFPRGAALGTQQICWVLEHPPRMAGSSGACGKQPSVGVRERFLTLAALDRHCGDSGGRLRGVCSIHLGQDLLLAAPLGCGPWSGWCQPLPHPRMTSRRAAPSLADLC